MRGERPPFASHFTFYVLRLLGIGLAKTLQDERSCRHMTRNQWLLLGAILLGLAVGLYFLFFCPTDCH